MSARRAFQLETWTELGVAILIVILRIGIRYKTVGIPKFRIDDYLIVPTLLFFVITSVLGVLVYDYGSISGLSADQILNLTPAERPKIELGGKLNVVSWAGYVCCIWFSKACLLGYYNSLT
ncbi:hypothetical protein BP6252_03961 [Coleophoma cylindrospora]|uniref:Uncharacterized protein n=1 Tax=Coleophoma cylindrospora TaxID=1849047 RepID=A0A3D8S924_9HELO|nr:hypothetical protein BP6252_03961 [Coleophoma cylindrospora]